MSKSKVVFLVLALGVGKSFALQSLSSVAENLSNFQNVCEVTVSALLDAVEQAKYSEYLTSSYKNKLTSIGALKDDKECEDSDLRLDVLVLINKTPIQFNNGVNWIYTYDASIDVYAKKYQNLRNVTIYKGWTVGANATIKESQSSFEDGLDVYFEKFLSEWNKGH
ncbi:hypothetical protein [Deinococcus roseus]|uniref:Uncharacterized protein n=1 Tax=Deinococcus roseus TaxID=392414 RepID=A0ABQ2DKT8_9DEIO|nr:hypothetical protein [Deinococcus roseus]GGJ59818.1 hypothetical protein GCM10008938_52450 [Deinococcus roseus]